MIFFVWSMESLDEAPAATLHHFATMARAEVSGLSSSTCKKNASRDSHRFIKAWGLSWKIPMSYLQDFQDGVPVQVPYLSPKSVLKFLLEKAHDLLLGGCSDVSQGQEHLRAFWQEYAKVHSSHILFAEQHEERSVSNTVPVSLHGDEGRGLKKSNTTVVMMEANLGVGTFDNMSRKRNLHDCSSCELGESAARKFQVAAGPMQAPPAPQMSSYQTTNLRGNSFLSKFVLGVIPRKKTLLVDQILLAITRDFNDLFTEGITMNDGSKWFFAVTGWKGDLKWFQAIGSLQRCFSRQLAVGAPMCHECMAGSEEYPFEDFSDGAAWSTTTYSQRPFPVIPVVCHVPFEKVPENNDQERPYEKVFRRDVFHNMKVGCLRDFIGSTVMLLCRLKYFNEAGMPNGRDVLLRRAHDHFQYFCKTTNRSPALHAFTKEFFNASTWNTFAWVSTKGSDTSLMLAWVQVLTAGFMNDPIHPNHVNMLGYLNTTAKAARKYLEISYSHGLWLDKHCGRCMYQELKRFLDGYNGCAFLSLHQFQFTGFALKSKLRMMAHEKLDLLRQLENTQSHVVLNVHIFGCEMNEDIVGKLCRLSRRVSTRLTCQRTLELYLTKCKAVYKRHRESHERNHALVRRKGV